MGVSLIQGSYTSYQVSGVGFTIPAPSQTLIQIYNRTITTTDTIYSTTTKKFYCTGIVVTNTGVSGTWSIEDNTSGTFAVLGYCAANDMKVLNGGATPLFVAPLSTTIKGYHAFGTNKMAVTLIGFTQ